MLQNATPMAYYNFGDPQYSTLSYIITKPATAPAPGTGVYEIDPLIPSIDNAIYSSDEFRMYAYKIKRCPRTRSHDWTNCPYAHRGEKATRRDPRRYSYYAVACPAFKNGVCYRGETCEFAHGVFEYWLHPSRYRTKACNAGSFCQRKVCFFAHGPEELREGDGKNRPCRFAYRPVRVVAGEGGGGGGSNGGDGVRVRLGGGDEDTSRGVDSNEEERILKCLSEMSLGEDQYEPSDLDLDLAQFGWVSELVD